MPESAGLERREVAESKEPDSVFWRNEERDRMPNNMQLDSVFSNPERREVAENNEPDLVFWSHPERRELSTRVERASL